MIEKEKSEPLYKQIKKDILYQIENNELKKGEKIPSMVELSKHFEVSLITIKQAISELVNEGYLETRGSKGTYVKDKRKERSKEVGIIFPALAVNPFFNEIYSSIENILKVNDFSFYVYNTDYNIEREIRYLKELKEKKVGGIIFCPCYSGSDSPSVYLLSEFLEREIPVIFLDIKIEGIKIDYVRSDNFRGGYEATKYLIELGHKRIGFILSREVNTTSDRIKGYRKALEEYGMKYDDLLIKKFNVRGNYEEIGYSGTLELMNLKNPPTAIITSTDTIAIGIYKACHELRLKIPDDVSVIGYDNLSLSQYLIPALTTVDQRKYELGVETAKLLLRRVNGDKEPYKDVILKPILLKRESCSKVKEKERRII